MQFIVSSLQKSQSYVSALLFLYAPLLQVIVGLVRDRLSVMLWLPVISAL